MQLTGTCHSAAATGDGDGDGGDVVIACNNYLNAAIIFMQTRSSAAQWAICSLSLSLSFPLTLSLSRTLWNIFTIFTILLLLSRAAVRLLLLLLLLRAGFNTQLRSVCVHAYAWYLKNTKRQYDTK